jgi:hypothetical protein
MQFGRYEEDDTKIKESLPHEWLEEFTKILNEAYSDVRKKNTRFFDVYGEIYDKDFVVIISYIDNNDPMKAPISLFISHDILEDSKAFKKCLKQLIDFASQVLDDVFAADDWYEYNALWTENQFGDSKFNYKITRENISLTIQANALFEKEDNEENKTKH